MANQMEFIRRESARETKHIENAPFASNEKKYVRNNDSTLAELNSPNELTSASKSEENAPIINISLQTYRNNS